MRTLIFRHAEKNNFATSDPGLSPKGHAQSQHILRLIQTNELPKPDRLFSSPKLRARQTLQEAANNLGLEVQIWTELNERQAAETHDQFERRVKQTLLKIEALPGIVYFVTHLDWIEEALIRINSDTDLLDGTYQYWPPAQNMEFEIHDGLWSLKKFRAITES